MAAEVFIERGKGEMLRARRGGNRNMLEIASPFEDAERRSGCSRFGAGAP